MRVVSSEIPALAARFWKLVMYFWKPCPVFLSEGLLNKFSEVRASHGFDVKGIEGGFEVFGEFIKGLFFGVNGGIGHLVIPHFREVDASTLTHLV